MNDITLIVPYYRNPRMLVRQIQEWATYPQALKIIVVDDCSPEPALKFAHPEVNVQVYRILDDIKWNRNGARNLGAHVATTKWIMQIDIDHLMYTPSAKRLMLPWAPSPNLMYRFRRFRNGAADETRMKDKLPRDCTYGEIKPHGDSYLCTRAAYWRVGGYDEDYSGHLGGGSPFLQQLERITPPALAPPDVQLTVFTRSTCMDASDTTLSRDTGPYSALRKLKERTGDTKAKDPLRFKWERVL